MTGGLASFVRAFESIPTDAPIADRFHATLEASDAFMAECDRIQMQHRADMVARWGLDEAHFERGPGNPTLTNSDALREMQLAPAEALQPDTDEQPVITLRFGLGLLALSLAMIGVHWVWAVRL